MELQGLRDYGYMSSMACEMLLSCQDLRYRGLLTEFVIVSPQLPVLVIPKISVPG